MARRIISIGMIPVVIMVAVVLASISIVFGLALAERNMPQPTVVGTWQFDCTDGGNYKEVLRPDGSYTDTDVEGGKYNGTYKLQGNAIVYVRYFSSVPNMYVPDTRKEVTESLSWTKSNQKFTITYQSANPPFPQDPPHRSCTAKRIS